MLNHAGLSVIIINNRYYGSFFLDCLDRVWDMRETRQTSLSDIEYSNRRRHTRRESFLDLMDSLVRWDYWVGEIRPYYPEGRRGRPPKDIEMMLRMYLLKDWFGLSDEGIEDAIYDSYAMRKFMHLDFMDEQVPGASTLSRFRRLLEDHGIGERISLELKESLAGSGLSMRAGKVVDAAVIKIGRTR